MSLPSIDTAIERAVTDWKSEDRGTAFHRAKGREALATELDAVAELGRCGGRDRRRLGWTLAHPKDDRAGVDHLRR